MHTHSCLVSIHFTSHPRGFFFWGGGGVEIKRAKPKYMGSIQEPCPFKRDYCIKLRASIYLEKITKSQNDELITKNKIKMKEHHCWGCANLFSAISTHCWKNFFNIAVFCGVMLCSNVWCYWQVIPMFPTCRMWPKVNCMGL